MKAIVLDLQKDSISSEVSITDLLRKALLVARKLKVTEFENWIRQEMEGYSSDREDIPPYWVLTGRPEIWNPFHEWQPLQFEDQESATLLSTLPCKQAISELEHLIKNAKGGRLEFSYPPNTMQAITKSIGRNVRASLRIHLASVSKIIDTVSNIILRRRWNYR